MNAAPSARSAAKFADEVGLFVPATEVFPDTAADEATLLALLRQLSRDDTLFHCARLNIIISGGDDPARGQARALATYARPAQIARIDDFARRYRRTLPPTVFFRGQVLELMRWTARHARNLPGDGKTFEDPACRERFMRAVLIASTIWSERVYGDRLSVATAGDLDATRRRALGAMRRGVEEGNAAPHFGVAIGRGLELFTRYLPRHLPDFEAEFERRTGLTVGRYLGCAAVMAMYALPERKEGPLFVAQAVAAATEARETFAKFLAIESQTPEELADLLWRDFGQAGYRALRERPVMSMADGRSVILDPTFFLERISAGPLFHVAKGRAGLPVFSAFGDAFESYARDILRRMYPSRPGLIDRAGFGLRGRDGAGREFEIDATVADAGAAAFFEMKAAFIPEAAIGSADPEDLVQAVLDRYGAAVRPGERDKGVAQLARSVGAVARGEWSGRQGEFAGTAVLHPVLVAHDTRLDAPVLTAFLESEFRTLLGPVPTERRVAPLTVMTIADLENLEGSVEGFALLALLDDYARAHPDRSRSLHNFIAFSGYAAHVVPNPALVDASYRMLGTMRAELFPSASASAD